jgi:uncharacterized damage-inducible protein DinB
MEPIFEGFFAVLQAMHKDCKAALTDMSQEELDHSPGEGMNSLAVLAAHIAGSGSFWISDVVMGQPTGRDRPSEFVTSGVDRRTLSDRLDGSLSRIGNIFENLSVEQLSEYRTAPGWEEEFTVAWAIGHILEHTALHLGHMQVTRQLLEQGRGE